jgi:hypothetical protein
MPCYALSHLLAMGQEHRDVGRANARAVHALEHFGVKVTVNAVALMLLFEQAAGGLP